MKRMAIVAITLVVGTLGCTNLAEVAVWDEALRAAHDGKNDDGKNGNGNDKEPRPPEPVLCRVTGGGQILAGDFRDSFGGNAQPVRSTVRGQWNHVTHDGDHFHGQPDSIECFNVPGPPAAPPVAPANAARFSGTGRFNRKQGCAFTVYVEDHGEPGTLDFYSIEIVCPSTATYSAGDTLLNGNIQIHAIPPGHQAG